MTYKDIERSIKLLNELNQKHWTEVGYYIVQPVQVALSKTWLLPSFYSYYPARSDYTFSTIL